MSMFDSVVLDFFDTQRREARNRSLWRLAYLVAIVCMIASIGLYASLLTRAFGSSPEQRQLAFWLAVGLVSLLVTVAALLHPIARQRGHDIARGLGGQSLSVQSDLERVQLLNVTAEMAISAGLPCPRIYVLEEETAVNAFAIGRRPTDSVIVITAGSFLHLSRDELQALVAWCMARIRDGESTFDTELLRLNHGLMAPFNACAGLLRTMWSPTVGAADAYGGADMAAQARASAVFASVWLVLGALISMVGYVLARLLQAAATRRSVLMSDAAVLQLMRAREPLLRLLLKLKDDYRQSRMHVAIGEEITHLCFAPASWLPRLILDSHPSAERRWQRIGHAAEVAAMALQPKRRVRTDAEVRAVAQAKLPVNDLAMSLGLALAASSPDRAQAASDDSAPHVAVTFSTVPDVLKQRSQSPEGAFFAMLGVFCAPPKWSRFEAMVSDVRSRWEAASNDAWLWPDQSLPKELWAVLETAPATMRLSLMSLLWPAWSQLPTLLQTLSEQAIQREMVRDGRRPGLLEWAQWSYLESLLRQQRSRLAPPRNHTIAQRAADLRHLLLWMVRRSGAKGAAMLDLLNAHERGLGLPCSSAIALAEHANLDEIVERLRFLEHRAQQQVLLRMQEIAGFDRVLSLDEWLFLRCIAASWDCPIALPER